MSDRKAELERKKERLRQMREEKERRRREKEKLDADSAAQSLLSVSVTSLRSVSPARSEESPQASIDRVLADVGIAPVDSVLKSAAAAATGFEHKNAVRPEEEHVKSDPGSSISFEPPSLKALSVVSVQATNILPKEIILYSKQTQTLDSGPTGVDVMISSRRGGSGFDDYYTLTYDEMDEQYEEDSIPGMESGGPGSPSAMTYLSGNKLPPGILPHGMPEVRDVKPALTKDDEAEEELKKKEEKSNQRVSDLSEEEKLNIMMSEDFHKFIDRSTRLTERTLCEMSDANLFVDYTGGFADDDSEGLDGDKSGGGVKISMNRCFYDEKSTKNRVVTSLDWSTVFPELLLVSYDKSIDVVHDSDGLCVVWNTRFKKTSPEYIFHCQSQVMSAAFASFHQNLVLGGTYSGQIVLWDNRVGQKRTPVQRSPLSSTAHTHPVYCMKVVGSKNAHNLISISTDGKLCSWSLDMLSQPQETLQLQHKQGKQIPVTSFAFPAGDVNNFIVGSEEGNVYTACRHGSRAGVLDMFDGHQGAPVTGLSAHHGVGPVDFSQLFLTSSIDWTIKLWSLKESKPLYSFEDNGDYVYDVAWSPIHPALFASVDGNGRLDLWNLNSDTEVATSSIYVGASQSGELTSSNGVALNRVSWTQSGLHVTVGDDMGKIWVYDVGEALAVPGQDEWAKFGHTLVDLKQNKIDQEDRENQSIMASGNVGGGSSGYFSMSSGGGGYLSMSGVSGGSGPNSLTSIGQRTSSPSR